MRYVHQTWLVMTLMSSAYYYAPLLSGADVWAALDAIDLSHKDKAKSALEALVLEHPQFYPAHYNLGTLLMDSERDAAATHFETATASPVPTLQHDAWFNLALVRFHQGRLEQAVAAANKALALGAERPETKALRDELVRIALIRSDEARRKAEEEAKKLAFSSKTLPDGHVGEMFDHLIPARGGSGGYRFALGAPSAPPDTKNNKTPPTNNSSSATKNTIVPLPAGMTLDDNGRFHGTPTTPGTHELSLVLTDSANASVQGNITWIIQPKPALITEQLPEAIQDTAYSAIVESIGLRQPQWTVNGLPPGLKASTTPGEKLTISGTPTTLGQFRLSIVADEGKRRAERDYTLIVSDSFAPDIAQLPPATAWAAYQHQMGVRGKPQRYSWKSPGAGGMSIQSGGLITGTPDQAGLLSFPVTIRAETNTSREYQLTIPVNPPPVIDESTPIQLTTEQAIQRPIKITGGTAPYTWNIEQGVMPKGLRLDSDGVVRGSASEAGEVKVTLGVRDRWQARTQKEITFSVTKREKSDEQKQQEEQQKQQDQQNQDQQQQKDQQQNQQQNQQQTADNQQQNDGSEKDQQQKDQQQANADKSAADQAEQASGKQNQDQQNKQKQEQAEQRAHVLNQAAADRWLDNLPKEDRDVLRYQLLEGGQVKPKQDGKAW
jgi:Putative Ig domain/Tetratricopeptide repeat